MIRFLGKSLMTSLLITTAGCDQLSELGHHRGLVTNGAALEAADECNQTNPDRINCKLVVTYSNFIMDSFERQNVIDPVSDFGWRKIINDNGKVISGQAGNHVDVQIYSDQQMGPASDGTHAIYNFGRMGSSVHNIYLITRTFNLVTSEIQTDSVVIEFDYLAVDLESSEYLRLEVCNDNAENCGVGENLTLAGLNNQSKWKTVFEVVGEGQGRNGRNHQATDFATAKAVLFLEEFQKSEFIFRLNSRMNDGYVNNDHQQNMEDGVVVDNFRATAYDFIDGLQEQVEEPEEVLDLDPENLDNLL